MSQAGWLRLAHELKQPLHQLLGCPGPLTYRQFLAWNSWLDEQWNNPGLTEQYLMLIACEVRRVLMKEPSRVQPNDFQLKFKRKKHDRKAKAEKRKNEVAISKAIWSQRVGVTAPPTTLQ